MTETAGRITLAVLFLGLAFYFTYAVGVNDGRRSQWEKPPLRSQGPVAAVSTSTPWLVRQCPLFEDCVVTEADYRMQSYERIWLLSDDVQFCMRPAESTD